MNTQQRNCVLVAAGSGVVLSVTSGVALAAFSFSDRDEVLIWLIWLIPAILLLVVLRQRWINAFVVAWLSSLFLVLGVFAGGVAGPSSIAAGFTSVWSLTFAAAYGVIWFILERLCPRIPLGELPSRDVCEKRGVHASDNPYELGNN